MDGYSSGTYGDKGADLYDEWYDGVLETDACVDRLAELAGPGPVLELGVGTGRLALPLADRRLEVHGVDASARMLARLAAKPGGDRVRTILHDIVDVSTGTTYPLVVCAADTLFMLTEQDLQVRCLANVAMHLASGGVFVSETFVFNRTRYADGQDVTVRRVTAESLVLGAARHDPARQLITGHHILLREDGIRMVPAVLRYIWPAELDLMARLAGLRLRERWGGWNREPFTAASGRAVSVYELA